MLRSYMHAMSGYSPAVRIGAIALDIMTGAAGATALYIITESVAAAVIGFVVCAYRGSGLYWDRNGQPWWARRASE